jgi:hypothetical protein
VAGSGAGDGGVNDMAGQLRWLRGRNSVWWHLSWNGATPVCGQEIGPPDAPETRSLDDGPPTDLPIHAECQHLVARSVGFWEGSA